MGNIRRCRLRTARHQAVFAVELGSTAAVAFDAYDVLKDEQGLLSFLLVPPSAERTPNRQRHAG